MGKEDEELISVANPGKRSLLERYEIPIENISYEYITKCKNPKELEKIVKILRSGEEGYYPDLLKHAEKHLAILKPNSSILRTAEPVINKNMLEPELRKEIDNDIDSWMTEMKSCEKDLEDGKSLSVNEIDYGPEIRTIKKSMPKKNLSQNKEKRLASCDYAAWDKYDADTEVNRIDIESEKELLMTKKTQQKKKDERAKNQKISKESLIKSMSLTGTELRVMAAKEKEKGNDAFRAGDYEEALQLYSTSISMNDDINTYNNRAMTYIKLKQYEKACGDCNSVINIDQSNIKALLRRAMALEHLEKNNQALADYETILRLEPSNKVALAAAEKLRKFSKSKKVRMKIEEENSGENMKSSNARIKVPEKSNEYELCHCDRAAGSSKYTKPMPHCKSDYCLDVLNERERNKLSKNRGKIYDIPGTKKSSVIIEELPHDSTTVKFSKSSKHNKENVNNCSDRINETKKSKQENVTKQKINDSNMKNKTSSQQKFGKANNEKFLAQKESNNGTGNHEISMKNPENIVEYDKIETAFEFSCVWHSLKDDPDYIQHAKLLKATSPKDVENVIGNKLESGMMSRILKTFKAHFCNPQDIKIVEQFLKALGQISRIKIVILFMTAEDKEVLENLLSFMEKNGLPEVPTLRQIYSI